MLMEGIGRTNLHVLLLDQDMRVLYASASAAQMMGVAPEGVVGKKLSEIEGMPEEVAQRLEGMARCAFETGEPQRGEAHLEGSARDLFMTYEIVPLGKYGRATLVVATDVSEQRRYQRLLETLDRIARTVNTPQEESDILATVVPLIQNVLKEDHLVIVVRDEGRYRGSHTFPGLPERVEAIDLHPEAVRLVELVCREGRAMKVDDALTYPGLDPDFVAKWSIRAMMAVPLQVHGSMIGALALLRRRPQPFTEREVESAEKIAASVSMALDNSRAYSGMAASMAREGRERRYLQTILETLPVGVMVIDETGELVMANRRRDLIWGRRLAHDAMPEGMGKFKGRSASTGLKVTGRDWPIFRALDRGETVQGELIDIQRLDGMPATVMASAAPLHDPSGRRIGAVGVLLDLTPQRLAEQEALEAKATAEFYLDLLTHDIGNFHTVIAGNIALASKAEGEKREKMLAAALKAVEDGQRLVDTLRILQRVETQEDSHAPVDLGYLLEEVRDDYEKAGRTVRYELVTHRMVLASPLLKDLFVNLVDNAIKHSPDGAEVDIKVMRAFEGAKEQHKVVVEDNGPGIPDEVKGKVFQRGTRGRTSAGGRGLGLYLVKRLAEEFGGRVWVEDRVPGDHTKGAKFVVVLPSAGKETGLGTTSRR